MYENASFGWVVLFGARRSTCFLFCRQHSHSRCFSLFLRVIWLVSNSHSKKTLHSFVKSKLNSVRFHPQMSSTLSFIIFLSSAASYPSNIISLQICYTNTNGDVPNFVFLVTAIHTLTGYFNSPPPPSPQVVFVHKTTSLSTFAMDIGDDLRKFQICLVTVVSV